MRRVVVAGALAFAALFLSGLPVDDDAEALTKVRAKIVWSGVVITDALAVPPAETAIPAGVNDRGRHILAFPTETQVAIAESPLVFLRDNTLSRQSNPDPTKTVVVAGATFPDILRFQPSSDISSAVLQVHQPAFGTNKNKLRTSAVPEPDECHVAIVGVKDKDGLPRGEPMPPPRPGQTETPGLTEVRLGEVKVASAPYEIKIRSEIPRLSQPPPGFVGLTQRPSPRTLTSVIRLGEAIPDRGVGPGTPGPARRYARCAGEVGGRGVKSLNKTFVVRTEMQGNAWAKANGRSTPTVIAAR